MNIKEEIKSLYNNYIKENNVSPNVAYVKVQWYDDDSPEDCVQTIVIDGKWYDALKIYECADYVVPFIKDEDVLYYCSNIDSLIDITDTISSCDFKVVEIIGFEHLNNEE